MRVLNVISDSNIGGAGLVLINYLKYADREKFAHTVAVPAGSMLLERLDGIGIDTVEISGIGERSLSLKSIVALRRLIKALKADVVHTHANLSARIAARLYGQCAVVYTRHSAFDLKPHSTAFPMRQITGAINNALADVIIAVSPAALANLVDTGADPRKIFTMFNGVEPVRRLDGRERRAVRESLGIKSGEFVCSIIARLEEVKGHRYVLEAAKLLDDLPIRVIIAGTGSAEAELRARAAELGLTQCVFTGFVADTSGIENITDLQLNASFGTETSSLSLLEGMSLGTPAVVSDYGGNPHLITNGENGLVVPKKDARALADAVRALYNNSALLAGMSQKAHDAYISRFTAERMAADIEDVYEAACALRRGEKTNLFARGKSDGQ
ncbi:MAG: glycosyltransferase family 4 protein [Oscillospiraceae bacterium]|jgi:glycosyltransferase involved in cell wall biosynthesis|nr:glycosyltransferase family 4 protein [Oscillospiraceae bacterium]